MDTVMNRKTDARIAEMLHEIEAEMERLQSLLDDTEAARDDNQAEPI